MLFERWRQIAEARRDQVALRDLASGGQWTFGELAAAAAHRRRGNGKVLAPAGSPS